MTISYSTEAKFALLDTGAENWGAVVNGILEQIDEGFELNFTAEEAITIYDIVYISSASKVGKADANDAAKRPAIGIALNSAAMDTEVQVLAFGWIDYDDTAHGGALGATNGDTIYLSTTAGYLSITPDTDYPQVLGIAKTNTTAHITRILLSPVLHVHQLVDKTDTPTFAGLTVNGKVTITPTRGTEDYEYGLTVSSDSFFVAGAVKKTYLAYIAGDRLDGEAVTGDSNDALLRMAHSNYAENDANFIMRGINGSMTNGDGGTMNMLEGINYSVRQRGDAGNIVTLRGALLSIQMDTGGSYAVSGEVKGLKVEMRCEANCPAASAGIEVRNYTDGMYIIPTAAYSVKNDGTSGCLGFTYGIDFYDSAAIAVSTAEIRGSTQGTIHNRTSGKWTFNTGAVFAKTVHSASEADNGDSGVADTIDWTQGNNQKSTLTDNCTFTFNPEPDGPCILTLRLIQGGVGSYTVVWPADVNWTGNVPPTLSVAIGAVDIVSFYYDGASFNGQALLDLQ
jgi:hypothetical protein